MEKFIKYLKDNGYVEMIQKAANETNLPDQVANELVKIALLILIDRHDDVCNTFEDAAFDYALDAVANALHIRAETKKDKRNGKPLNDIFHTLLNNIYP